MRRRGLLVGSQATDGIPIGVNLFTSKVSYSRGWIGPDGIGRVWHDAQHTDYIRIDPAGTYSFYQTVRAANYLMITYDEAKKQVGWATGQYSTGLRTGITFPPEACYVRMNFRLSMIDQAEFIRTA